MKRISFLAIFLFFAIKTQAPERALMSPLYDAVSYNNYVNYMGTYGGNPWSFTPYASLYTNPFSNPSFAQNFPNAVNQLPFGPQLMNYMSYMNPLLFSPQGYGNTWKMGEFGLGSAMNKGHHEVHHGPVELEHQIDGIRNFGKI